VNQQEAKMADEQAKKPKLEVVQPATPSDATDIEALLLDPGLGDGITDVHWHKIPIGKPRNFFRAHPDKKFRRKTEVYVHKPEDAIEEQYYIIAPAMRGKIEEARTCVIVPCIYRDGSPAYVGNPVSALEREGQQRLGLGALGRACCNRWLGETGMGRQVLSDP
jgi:hypothetical protein